MRELKYIRRSLKDYDNDLLAAVFRDIPPTLLIDLIDDRTISAFLDENFIIKNKQRDFCLSYINYLKRKLEHEQK